MTNDIRYFSGTQNSEFSRFLQDGMMEYASTDADGNVTVAAEDFHKDIKDGEFAGHRLSQNQTNYLASLFKGNNIRWNGSGVFTSPTASLDRPLYVDIMIKAESFFAAAGLSGVSGHSGNWGELKDWAWEKGLGGLHVNSTVLENELANIKNARMFADLDNCVRLSFLSGGRGIAEIINDVFAGREKGRLLAIISNLQETPSTESLKQHLVNNAYAWSEDSDIPESTDEIFMQTADRVEKMAEIAIALAQTNELGWIEFTRQDQHLESLINSLESFQTARDELTYGIYTSESIIQPLREVHISMANLLLEIKLLESQEESGRAELGNSADAMRETGILATGLAITAATMNPTVAASVLGSATTGVTAGGLGVVAGTASYTGVGLASDALYGEDVNLDTFQSRVVTGATESSLMVASGGIGRIIGGATANGSSAVRYGGRAATQVSILETNTLVKQGRGASGAELAFQTVSSIIPSHHVSGSIKEVVEEGIEGHLFDGEGALKHDSASAADFIYGFSGAMSEIVGDTERYGKFKTNSKDIGIHSTNDTSEAIHEAVNIYEDRSADTARKNKMKLEGLSKDAILDAYKKGLVSSFDIPIELRDDWDMALELASRHPSAMTSTQLIPNRLKYNTDFILAAMQRNPSIAHYAYPAYNVIPGTNSSSVYEEAEKAANHLRERLMNVRQNSDALRAEISALNVEAINLTHKVAEKTGAIPHGELQDICLEIAAENYLNKFLAQMDKGLLSDRHIAGYQKAARELTSHHSLFNPTKEIAAQTEMPSIFRELYAQILLRLPADTRDESDD